MAQRTNCIQPEGSWRTRPRQPLVLSTVFFVIATISPGFREGLETLEYKYRGLVRGPVKLAKHF
ncbi:hypothetical protein GGP41_004894 [Bipolaris sorokiniana]|uniref:Uncharacterized protein n=1 Tax=Cochliobolus sativus TaxID=45130 RepID=A0A8H5ZCM2_COCSA|nr:hypothetical protein GGP41_004894 [Bipolaris sorokiniana]